MKKYLIILSAVLFFTGCSSNDKEPTQDYTSFVVWHNSDVGSYRTFFDVISAWKDSDGVFHKIAEHGDLLKGVKSEEFIMNEFYSTIYIFGATGLGAAPVRLNDIYNLQQNKKNIIFLKEGTTGIEVNTSDPKQYPQ